MNNEGDLDIEKDKLELERQKFKFEQEKYYKELEFQHDKFYKEQKSEKIKTILTVLSIILPLIAILVTISNNLDLQTTQARNDFTLKAAEIVMDAKTPIGTKNKALALQNLFPNYLDANFAGKFDPSSYSVNGLSYQEQSGAGYQREQPVTGIDNDNKEIFLEMLIQNGKLSTKELIDWYVKLFPENNWIDQNGTIFSLNQEKKEQNRVNGTVKFFNKIKNFGFITSANGNDYFVHISGLKPGVTIDEGDNVSFEIFDGEKGPIAVNVVKSPSEDSNIDFLINEQVNDIASNL